jgi:hypothetical protein
VTQSGKDELSRKTHLPPTSNLLHRPTIPNTSLTCSVHFQLFRTAAAEYCRPRKTSFEPPAAHSPSKWASSPARSASQLSSSMKRRCVKSPESLSNYLSKEQNTELKDKSGRMDSARQSADFNFQIGPCRDARDHIRCCLPGEAFGRCVISGIQGVSSPISRLEPRAAKQFLGCPYPCLPPRESAHN